MHGDNGKKRAHFIGKQNREIAEQFRFIEHGHIFLLSRFAPIYLIGCYRFLKYFLF
jgi:hypothetical protein